VPIPDSSRTLDPSPVLLFRYSALTFNSHRIHYDRPYAIETEGYPGLVVHGPLQATLLLQAAADLWGGKVPSAFSFRGTQPLFDLAPFTVNARRSAERRAELWVSGQDGAVHMRATAEWA
jgi:3-methylfumaryl-CoA hydratase